HIGFHLARVLDPEREICRGVGIAAGRDNTARSDVGEIGTKHTHRRRVARNRVAPDARGAGEDLFAARSTTRKAGSEFQIGRNRRMWNGVIRNVRAGKEVSGWKCSWNRSCTS